MQNTVSGSALCVAMLFALCVASRGDDAPDYRAAILTPPPPATPRINGPNVFGVRPGSPLLYTIPATGDRPMSFAVENLPDGLSIDSATGQITGSVAQQGTLEVVLVATNAKGTNRKKFRIVVGETISLTPAMGWNSWNCWAAFVDQEKVLRSAKAMVSSGLINHGWTYVNIDDGWQGKRTGRDHALQGNEKFPDMKGLCDQIHAMGLKAGIYSTPWITSYAGYCGGSSNSPDGAWSKSSALRDEKLGYKFGKYSFAKADANQWADWGIDYLKYDWNPLTIEHVSEMSQALRASGRDMVFSLSNTAAFTGAADWARWANSWRTTGDITDAWWSVAQIGFLQNQWASYAGPGHWNDADMLIVGYIGWGPKLRRTSLTPDEQYLHMSLWSLLSSPMLLGCDLERLDPFTLNLLTNDEVLAIHQDALGKQAVYVTRVGGVEMYMKPLEDGAVALGFFNCGRAPQKVTYDALHILGLTGKMHVRDVWRQKNLPDVDADARGALSMNVPVHGVMLYRLTPTRGLAPSPQ